jgi:hypothetical protein
MGDPIRGGVPNVNVPPAGLPDSTAAVQHVEEKHQEKVAAGQAQPKKDSYEPSMPSTVFGPSKPAVRPQDGRLSADVEFGKLPQDLQSKMSPELWIKLSHTQRNNVVQIYERLHAYGVWGNVTRVTGEAEKPAQVGNVRVAGATGSIAFELDDPAAFQKKLIDSGHFGKDGKIMNLFHQKQDSVREWGAEAGSLHISVGPGKKFDAHIDEFSPVGQPNAGHTTVDPAAAKKHGVHELLPSFLGGVVIDGNIVENREKGWHGAEGRITVGYEIRGPVPNKKDLTEPPAVDPAAKRALAQTSKPGAPEFPVPPGTDPADRPTRQVVAEVIAGRIREAARHGQHEIVLDDMPAYADPADRKQALALIEEIGNAVRRELIAERNALPADKRDRTPDPAAIVAVTVAFGPEHKTVSIAK